MYHNMDWNYVNLAHDGRIVDSNGCHCYKNAPVFRTPNEADQWLEEQDERATCQGWSTFEIPKIKNNY